jgi:hypothetical protein
MAIEELCISTTLIFITYVILNKWLGKDETVWRYSHSVAVLVVHDVLAVHAGQVGTSGGVGVAP